jgi:hypothetical protein
VTLLLACVEYIRINHIGEIMLGKGIILSGIM